MKRFIILIFLMCCLQVNAQDISYVKHAHGWYHIYDDRGKKTGAVSASAGLLVGYGSEFLIVRKDSWYYLYDGKGKRLRGLSKSNIGEIIAVNGNTFTSRLGSWIYLWNKEGKKLRSYSAR